MADVGSRGKILDVHMSVGDLYRNIMAQLSDNNQCRLSWLHRLLAKCNSFAEFDKALHVFTTFRERALETTPETATLLIKAACRAGAPEKALNLLKDMDHTRMFPTLGGVHYLMINFSLLKKTEAVLETFDIAKERGLKPTQRTFHILIRECVDNDRIDDAMKFAEESKHTDIVPNRVTYNILMNGCRKFNKPKEILQLRDQMNEHNIEINDTTVKFTALAHMMLGNSDMAVKAFKEYPELDTKMEDFCEKFFEVTSEDIAQKKCVSDLFAALKASGTQLPVTVENKLKELKSNLVKP
jgi:pentatricopeptide repeat protein